MAPTVWTTEEVAEVELAVLDHLLHQRHLLVMVAVDHVELLGRLEELLAVAEALPYLVEEEMLVAQDLGAAAAAAEHRREQEQAQQA
jgi:hypothetical protein